MNIDELKIANNKQTFLAIRSLRHCTDNRITIGIQTAITHRYTFKLKHNYFHNCGYLVARRQLKKSTCLRSELVGIKLSMCVPMACLTQLVFVFDNPLHEESLINALLLYAVIATLRSTNCASVSVMHTQTFGLSL